MLEPVGIVLRKEENHEEARYCQRFGSQGVIAFRPGESILDASSIVLGILDRGFELDVQMNFRLASSAGERCPGAEFCIDAVVILVAT
jgi:hypothetical protein